MYNNCKLHCIMQIPSSRCFHIITFKQTEINVIYDVRAAEIIGISRCFAISFWCESIIRYLHGAQ